MLPFHALAAPASPTVEARADDPVPVPSGSHCTPARIVIPSPAADEMAEIIAMECMIESLSSKLAQIFTVFATLAIIGTIWIIGRAIASALPWIMP
jgi:hypothetical protein